MASDFDLMLQAIMDESAKANNLPLALDSSSNNPPNEGLSGKTPNAPNTASGLPNVLPKPDPLATLTGGADWLTNARKSGPGNTMEDRVAGINANFNSQGIKASKDEKGQLVLESNNVVPIAGTGQSNVAGSVRAIIGQMQATKDPDIMRGLQATLNEAMAVESARINTDAMQHAQNKLGVPMLQQALAQAESLDRNDPLYKPGMGDSPETAKIRAQLDTARAASDIEAKRYLAGNVTFAGLQAAEKSAMLEAQRVSKLGDKKDLMDMRNMERRALKEDQLDQLAQGLTDDQKQNIRILDPTKARADDAELAAVAVKNKGNKQFMEAVQAPKEELPLLAATGNDHARTIILAKDKALGIPESVTAMNLAKMQEFISTPAGLGKALALTSGRGSEAAKEAKAMAMALNAPKGTKEEKAAAIQMKYDIAKKAVTASMTNNMLADVNSWMSTDPILNEAIMQSKVVSGKTDLTNVMTAYIGDKTGKEAHDRIDKLIELATKSAMKYDGSAFGTPNYMAIKQQLISTYNTKNDWLGKISGDAVYKALGTYIPIPGLPLPPVPLYDAVKAGRDLLKGDQYVAE